MESLQDGLGPEKENNRTIFLRESDPFLPVIPSPEIKEEPLEEELKTPPATPLHSPHAFLKEDRRLFSPPPVLTVAPTKLDNFETECSSTSHDTEIWNKPQKYGKYAQKYGTLHEFVCHGEYITSFRKKTAHPASLVLPSEGHPPIKRIKSNTVATLLDHSSKSKSESSPTVGIEHLVVHPILLVRSVT